MASTSDFPFVTSTEFLASHKKGRDLTEGNQFYVSGYSDGIHINQGIVVVITPQVSEPTIVRAPRKRSNSRPLALLLPESGDKAANAPALYAAARTGEGALLNAWRLLSKTPLASFSTREPQPAFS